MTDRTAVIRDLNDRFRTTLQGGLVLITQGVQALGPETVVEVVRAVREFTDFTKDNDPYGEHDFGNLTAQGQMVFWKIDYYDLDLRYGSPDPSDAAQTARVMTIMLASEY